MNNVFIFLTSAVAIIVFLSFVVILYTLRRRYSSTNYNKIKDRDKEIPKFQFVLPTYIPKTVTLQDSNDDVIDTGNGGKIDGNIDADMIDPELYKNGVEETKDNSPSTLGRLCFSVQYEVETEKLIVGLVRGQRIRPRTSNPTATPYVKVCLLPDKRKKLQTKARQKTPHPLFNEEFIFFCPLIELKQRCLRFTVCDFDRFSRQNTVGRVVFSLEENYEQILTDEGCVEIWREIEACVNCEAETSCTYFGEILFSLQYLPTAKRVAISIMKGKGFGVEGTPKKPSVYVKVAMIFGGKTVHTRKTAKSNSTEPMYSESFHFDLLDVSLERTSFVVTVVNNKELIGRVVVGPIMYATGTGLSHWNTMLNSPRNAVAMWHTLF